VVTGRTASIGSSFSGRMPAQIRPLRRARHPLRKNHRVPKPQPNRRTSHQLEACGGGYLLSLEDDAPIEGARAVFYVNISNPCWLWKGVDLAKPVVVKATVGQIPFNFQIGKTRREFRCRNRRRRMASSWSAWVTVPPIRLP